MDDLYYLLNRQLQQLRLAKQASNHRVRDIHLTMAIDYAERAIWQLRQPDTCIVGHCTI